MATYHEHMAEVIAGLRTATDPLGLEARLEVTVDDTADGDEPAPTIELADPDGAARANWHLRHLDRIERLRLEARRAFDAELDRIERRREEVDAVYERRAEWHRRPVRDWHRAILAADPTRKTITLAYGELRSRTPQKPAVHVADRDAFIGWARDHAPALLAITYSPDRKAIEAAIGSSLAAAGSPMQGESVPIVTGDGEIVPGVVHSLGDTSFSIRLAEGGDL
jgi:hypothetical protein